MAYAEKRGKGPNPWRARWQLPERLPNGRHKEGHEDGFRTKSAAVKYAQDQEAAIRAGTWIDPKLGQIPIATWFERWLPAQDFVPNTEETYLRQWKRHIRPRWGHLALATPSAVDFEEWRNELRAGGMSESSVGIVFSILRGLYEAAVTNRMIHFSPFPPKKRGRRRASSPLAAKREGIVVPLEQLERILLRLKPPEMLLALTTVFTGMRWSEVAAMRRRFLTLDPGDPAQGSTARGTYLLDPLVGAVHEDVHGNRFLGAPKSGPGRVFDLPGFLVLLLHAYLATLPAAQEILFPDSKGNYRRHADWNRTRWRPACDGKPAAVFPSGRVREAVVPVYAGLWLHDLKHTHKAMMTDGRVHPVMMDYRMGHVQPGAPAVYSHPTPQMRRELIDCLDRVWSEWNPTQLTDTLAAWLGENVAHGAAATPKLLPTPPILLARDNALF